MTRRARLPLLRTLLLLGVLVLIALALALAPALRAQVAPEHLLPEGVLPQNALPFAGEEPERARDYVSAAIEIALLTWFFYVLLKFLHGKAGCRC